MQKDLKLLRMSSIPPKFASYITYRQSFTEAIYEHIQLQLADLAMKFWLAYRAAPRNKSGKVDEDVLHAKGVHLYQSCRLAYPSCSHACMTLDCCIHLSFFSLCGQQCGVQRIQQAEGHAWEILFGASAKTEVLRVRTIFQSSKRSPVFHLSSFSSYAKGFNPCFLTTRCCLTRIFSCLKMTFG